jgi:tetratricopeptide (TPR) repeat protein
MAKKRKRLNKKVALIGSLVLAVFLLGVVVVVLRFSKNPQKFLADAEVALAQYDYEGAEVNYRQAYGCAKDDDLKIEILFKIADLHLIDDEVHEHEPDWLKVIGCWNTAITIDPKNTKARMFLLKYFYEVGDSGNPGAWQTVESTASELAQIIDEKLEKPDTYVLLAKARAKLEMASFGQTSDREKTLAEAVAELEQLKELAPENIDIYKYLARAETIQGEIDSSKGLLGAAQKAAEKAEEILQRAVDMSPDNPEESC